MKHELVITKDGSHTLFVPELNEHYHSINGAVEESLHVFIQAGLSCFVDKREDVNILEIGFGTGLNAALTEKFAENHQLSIRYTALEAFPLLPKIIQQLNYIQCEKINQDLFLLMHQMTWNQPMQILRKGFSMEKLHILLEDYQPPKNCFDLIYFDAFAPDIQPVLWEKSIFENLHQSLKANGILTTYSAKGEVRRNLQSVGFIVERLPGALGKREMLRAKKVLCNS